ncbi:MAG: multicopper oxidase domain-containing protein [bacterium]
MNRRTFLKRISQTAVVLGATRSANELFASPSHDVPLATNQLRIPTFFTSGDLVIARTDFNIYSGTKTNVISVNNSFIGPTIKLQKGQNFSAKIVNNLTEPAVIHWHGLHAPAAMDGHPKNAIAAGASYDVSFPIIQRAGTYFYHSHTDMNTAKQTYMGLAGCFIVEDDEEKAVGLPSGEYDIPLMIQDKRFDSSKQLAYAPGDQAMPSGWLGDTILVNGTPDAVLDVSPTQYRFRIINASNARTYKLALKGNLPSTTMTLIGNDGGLLPTPTLVTSVLLSPAERIDVIVDLRNEVQGSTLQIVSEKFDYSGSSGTSSLAQGSAFNILDLQVSKTGSSGFTTLPAVLSTMEAYHQVDVKNSRLFAFNGTQYINFNSYDVNRIDEHVPLGALEQWTFQNASEEAHPIHVHGTQFQVVSPVQPSEAGWKDVIRVEASHAVNVLVRFDTYTGIYLLHCHNLEHEDMGMMSNFQVEQVGAVRNQSEAQSLSLFPNPCNKTTLVSFSPIDDERQLIVTDFKGVELRREQVPVGVEMFGLDTSAFAEGTYFIKLGGQLNKLIVLR